MIQFKYYVGIINVRGKYFVYVPSLNFKAEISQPQDNFVIETALKEELTSRIRKRDLIPAADGYFQTIVKTKKWLTLNGYDYNAFRAVSECFVTIEENQ